MSYCTKFSKNITHEQGTPVNIPMSLAMQDKLLKKNLSTIQHTLFVMSGKGGVGKSSVTVNLAAAIAEKGFNVGILDVDIHGPSIPKLLGLSTNVYADDNGRMMPVCYNESLVVVSMDSFLENKDTAIIWKGPKKAAAIRQFLTEVNWGELDFLLIDSPPGTGDEPLAVLDAIPDAHCVVVTTPQELSLADVRKAIDFLQQVNASILGVVENMSGLFCPNCSHEIELFKKGGGQQLAQQKSLSFLGMIALDPIAVIAADQGKPIVYMDITSKAKDGFLQLADKTIVKLQHINSK